MNHQQMNLNISYDLPNEIWEKSIPEIYSQMDGWMGFGKEGLPYWFSCNENVKHINEIFKIFIGLRTQNRKFFNMKVVTIFIICNIFRKLKFTLNKV